MLFFGSADDDRERSSLFSMRIYIRVRVLYANARRITGRSYDDRSNTKKAGKETRGKGGVRTKHLRVIQRHLESQI